MSQRMSTQIKDRYEKKKESRGGGGGGGGRGVLKIIGTEKVRDVGKLE